VQVGLNVISVEVTQSPRCGSKMESNLRNVHDCKMGIPYRALGKAISGRKLLFDYDVELSLVARMKRNKEPRLPEFFCKTYEITYICCDRG